MCRIILIALAVPGFLFATGCAGVGAVVGGAIDGPGSRVDSVMAWRNTVDPNGSGRTDSTHTGGELHMLLQEGAPGRGRMVLLFTDRDSLIADGILPDTIKAAGVPGFRLDIGEHSRFIPLDEVRDIRLGRLRAWGSARIAFVAAGALLDGLAIAFFVTAATQK